MASPPRRRASPPVLPDELVEEILLHLPPDDPACLLRASAVCKTWSSAVTHRSFRRRIHELHRTPPVLGFLHDWYDEHVPNFVPTTASAFSFAAPDRQFWRALDCRHGRALFLSNDSGAQELLVWEPITGRQRRVSVPAAAFDCGTPDAAVFCAADACDHCYCHGGPFRVVFVFTKSSSVTVAEYDSEDEDYVTSACVYSSETGFHHMKMLLRVLQAFEAQEVNDTLGDVPLLDCINDEESVKNSATSSKDEAGNSKTSGSKC